MQGHGEQEEEEEKEKEEEKEEEEGGGGVGGRIACCACELVPCLNSPAALARRGWGVQSTPACLCKDRVLGVYDCLPSVG